MGLEILNGYCPYSFHPISAKLYEAIGYHGGIQAVTFRFSTGYCSHRLIQFQSNFAEKMIIWGGGEMGENIRRYDNTFSGRLPNLEKIWQFEIFVNTGLYGGSKF